VRNNDVKISVVTEQT